MSKYFCIYCCLNVQILSLIIVNFVAYCFRSNNHKSILEKSLVGDFINMIDEYNVLAKSFQRVRDLSLQDKPSYFTLRLFRNRLKDQRVYNTPLSNEIAALIVGDFANTDVDRDIIVNKVCGDLSRLHEIHCFHPTTIS